MAQTLEHGQLLDLEQILEVLRSNRAELEAMGVLHVAVFGSLARGDHNADSDIDLVVDIDRTRRITGYALCGIELHLEKLFGRKVDLVTEPVSRKNLQAEIDRDRVRAF